MRAVSRGQIVTVYSCAIALSSSLTAASMALAFEGFDPPDSRQPVAEADPQQLEVEEPSLRGGSCSCSLVGFTVTLTNGCTFNTGPLAPTLTCGGSPVGGVTISVESTADGQIAVYSFSNNVHIPDSDSVSAFGTRPMRIEAFGTICINGVLQAPFGNLGGGQKGSGGPNKPGGAGRFRVNNGAAGTAGANGANGTGGAGGMGGMPGGTGGDMGLAGMQGYELGLQGVGGPAPYTPGWDGTTGEDNGTDGTDGTLGTDGAAGTVGTNGTGGGLGAAGTAGTAGTFGFDGFSGIGGFAGSGGSPGFGGNIGGGGGAGGNFGVGGIGAVAGGAGGTAGPRGLAAGEGGQGGARGEAGTAGATFGTGGIHGEPGEAGEGGPACEPGLPGERGERGDNGTNGANGIKGGDGVEGIMGGQGTPGGAGGNGGAGNGGGPGGNGTAGGMGQGGLNLAPHLGVIVSPAPEDLVLDAGGGGGGSGGGGSGGAGGQGSGSGGGGGGGGAAGSGGGGGSGGSGSGGGGAGSGGGGGGGAGGPGGGGGGGRFEDGTDGILGDIGVNGDGGENGENGKPGLPGNNGAPGINLAQPTAGTPGGSGQIGQAGGSSGPGNDGGAGGGAVELRTPGTLCLEGGTINMFSEIGACPGGGGGGGGTILLTGNTILAANSVMYASGANGCGEGGFAGKIVFNGATVDTTNANLAASFGSSGGNPGGAGGAGGIGGAGGAAGAGGAGGVTLRGVGGALVDGGAGGKGGKGGDGGGGGAGGDGGKPGSCPNWCDSLTVFGGPDGGTYYVSPTFWTYNGEIIGLTYRDGETHVVPPNQSVCACIEYVDLLGEDPNDFHFIADYWYSPDGVIVISGWCYFDPFGTFVFIIEFYIPIFPGDYFMDFTYDFTGNPNDPNMIAEQNGVVLYNGPRSAFNPAAHNLRQISYHSVLDTGRMDCNNNSILDVQEIHNNPSLDCNYSGVLDQCDIGNGFSQDVNGNNMPDECDGAAGFLCHTCYGDADGSGRVTVDDIPRLVEEILASSHVNECVDANQDSLFDGRDVRKTTELMLANNGAGTDCPNIYHCAGATGACESVDETPGCSDPVCCDKVCSTDRYCCDIRWDGLCATLADRLCRLNGASIPESCVSIGDGIFVGTTANNTPGSDITSCTSGDTVAEWYCYSPPFSGTATASLCDSFYDCAVAVFDGYPGPPTTQLACNDDFNCDGAGSVELQSQVSWPATFGNTYYIRVSGYQGDTGSYRLVTSCTNPPLGACCMAPNCWDGMLENDCLAGGGFWTADFCSDVECLPSICDNSSWCQLPHVISNVQQGGYVSDADHTTLTADDFRPSVNGAINQICWRGFHSIGGCSGPETFSVKFYRTAGNVPDLAQNIGSYTVTPAKFLPSPMETSGSPLNTPQYKYEAILNYSHVSVSANTCYWVEIQNTTPNAGCVWQWATSDEGGNNRAAIRKTGGGGFAYQNVDRDLSFCLGSVTLNAASCTFAPAAPSNNSCASAIHLSTNATVLGTTIGATRDGTATCGNSNSVGGDVWYRFTTGVIDQPLTVSTCGVGTTFDSVVSIHKTNPAVPVECPGTTSTQVLPSSESCDDEGCTGGLGTQRLFFPNFPARRQASFTAIDPNTSYLIRIAGKDSAAHPNGSKGVFVLTVTQP